MELSSSPSGSSHSSPFHGPAGCLSSSRDNYSYSEETHVLDEALANYYIDLYTDPEDEAHQAERQARERFLREFPQVKVQLEEIIAKLHTLADRVDKVHWDCTITNMVAASIGAVSDILNMVGLALAPVTAGVGMALRAMGMGFGAAAAVAGASTAIVEHVTRASTVAEASRLTWSSINQVELITETVVHGIPNVFNITRMSIQVVDVIGKNVRAIKIAETNTHLVHNAKCLMTAGKISARSTRKVQQAFGGTALAMTNGARIAGMATAGLFLLKDVFRLVQGSVHLHQGAKSELAQGLRQWAQQLEEYLAQLMVIYRSLQWEQLSEPGPRAIALT
ncbi:apolipoprotein L3-like [Ochotona curzoniae]|uniref:apolipoprotein L3-like n=1 Tax=Ochotona curzoniae TaxID=130825 RepID=UPI001B348EFB|nr:apolipoprotein L3-like [Ochotona curzoniae]